MAQETAHRDTYQGAAVRAAQLACFVHLAKADSMVKHVETDTIEAIMAATGPAAERVTCEPRSPSHDITPLRDLDPGLKQQFMKLLWLLALCDGDLHAEEERLIYQIGDMIDVDRRTLAATQRFVTACLDPDGTVTGTC